MAVEDIAEVVLVGGSTRIPLVRQAVETLFRARPHTELNPDEVVALGAAVQAGILSGDVEDTLLLDVTPLSLGIETMGGVVSKLIHRNSTIPASATEKFTTAVDGQRNVLIHVVQGERELVKDCRSLARFDLKDIDPVPAGMARIEVRFLIDANGILNVTARDVRTGKEQSVDVKPSYGLERRAGRSHDPRVVRKGRRRFPRASGSRSAGRSRRDPCRDRKGQSERRLVQSFRGRTPAPWMMRSTSCWSSTTRTTTR